MECASIGSISSGTMRTEDLLPAFASELEYQIQRNAKEWCSDAGRRERDRLCALAGNANDVDFESDDYDSDEAQDILDELFEALEIFAPPYAYFGAHEGDGADYGYWLSADAIDCSFDGLRVNDTGEVPEDYSGEVLHTNDHGNLTLYAADKGELREVWALV